MTLTRGTNGKGEEIGPGLPTTVVSVVHSEHPSRGALGTESLRSEIQDTWISLKKMGGWQKNWCTKNS